MTRIDLRIEGKTPLLLNKFTDAAAISASKGTSKAQVGKKGTPREQAESKLYISAHDGKCILPQPNIFSSFMGGGSFFKVGKKQVTTAKTSMLPACLEMDEVEYPIIHKEPWTVDTRAVRIPATGGRILAHRPCFHDWAIEMELTLDDEILSDDMLRDVIDAAGKRVGIGDFRPSCKGPFGKFVVTRWKKL